ncbi:MAG: SGNH/GDSL hydrolase family protein [Aliishimia sp.]
MPVARSDVDLLKDQPPRILAMGDSLLAWNRPVGRSISDNVETRLGVPVVDRSVIGARMLYALPISGALGLNISKQYLKDDWDWVIINGGGNDLWFGCGCVACDRKIDKMVTSDGTSGAIPDLVAKLRNNGARVLYLGYLRTPGKGSLIDHCANEGAAFEARLETMAKRDNGVYFMSLTDLVPVNDLSLHDFDRIHPSQKGSSKIGARIAAFIRSKDT